MDKLAFALDLKGVEDDGSFEGYASTFGERDLGGDIVMPGAFKSTLKTRGARGIKMLADHDPTKRIGIWSEVAEDEKGLYVKGRLLTEKQIARDMHIDLKSQAIDGLSIGFRSKSDSYDGRRRARLLKEVDLLEISLVTFPMNEGARVTSVKAAEEIKTIREFEDFLRDVGGFSNAQAKAIASQGFKGSEPRDEDGTDLAALLRRNLETLSLT